MSMNELENKVAELRELRRMKEDLEAEITNLEDSIKAHMTALDTDTLHGPSFKITWKNIESKRFDKARMIDTFGQRCYDDFCKITTSRRLVVA